MPGLLKFSMGLSEEKEYVIDCWDENKVRNSDYDFGSSSVLSVNSFRSMFSPRKKHRRNGACEIFFYTKHKVLPTGGSGIRSIIF